MVRIGTRRVIIGILWGSDPQPARHVQYVGDGDFRSGIVFAAPLRNRSRSFEIVNAAFDQNAKQSRRQALSHRPALERRARRDPWRVSLSDNLSSPRDYESRSHSFAIG